MFDSRPPIARNAVHVVLRHRTEHVAQLSPPDLLDMTEAFLTASESAMTRRGYTSDLLSYLRWLGSRDPRGATDSDLQDYRDWMSEVVDGDGRTASTGVPRLAPRTIARRLSVVRSFYAYLAKNDAIAASPAVNVASPQIDRQCRQRGLTVEQLGRLLEAAADAGYNEHLVVCLLALNGLRVGEVCRADASSLKRTPDDELLLDVGGGTDVVRIPLHPRAAGCIEALGGEHRAGPLATRPDLQWARGHPGATPPRRRYSQQTIGRLVAALGRAAGVVDGPSGGHNPQQVRRLHPQMLRQTFIELLLADAVTLTAVRGAARHRSTETTYRYQHESPHAEHPVRVLDF
jgi:integrase/recombinase XerD